MTTNAIPLFVRFLREETGQDLIEYGLLASIVAIAGSLLFPGIVTKMQQNFAQWGVNANGAWVPNDPIP